MHRCHSSHDMATLWNCLGQKASKGCKNETWVEQVTVYKQCNVFKLGLKEKLVYATHFFICSYFKIQINIWLQIICNMLILTLCSVFFSVTGHSSNFFPSASPFDDSNILDRRLANYEQRTTDRYAGSYLHFPHTNAVIHNILSYSCLLLYRVHHSSSWKSIKWSLLPYVKTHDTHLFHVYFALLTSKENHVNF